MKLMILIITSLCAIISIIVFILSVMRLGREVTNKEDLKLIVNSMKCDEVRAMISGGIILIAKL